MYIILYNLLFAGHPNGYHQEGRQSSRNSSESSSECTVTIPNAFHVKTEPPSPHEDDHETNPTDHNNNDETPVTSNKRAFSDMNADEPSHTESQPKTSRTRSPVSKINDSSIDMLQRIFPQQSRAVLELIMRSSDNDVVKAIESLIPDGINHSSNPPSVVSIQSFASPYGTYNSHPEERHKSAFSPITKNGVCLKKSGGQVSAFQPIHQPYSRAEVSPTAAIYPDHFNYPVAVKSPQYARHASAALLSLSSSKHMHIQGEQRPTIHCSHCGFKINIGDKFCSECGKCLLTKEGLTRSWTT